MLGKLSLEVEEGVFVDAFPVEEITRSWMVANFGEGVFRMSFVSIDKSGRRTPIPPSSGAIDLREPAATAVPRAPAEPAPAPPGLDVASILKLVQPGPSGEAITPLGLLQVVLQVQESAEQRAAAAYERQIERDRAFVTTLLQMRPAAPPLAEQEDDDDQDDDEDDDMATRVAKAVGEQLGPITKALKSWAEKGGEG